MKLCTKCNIEKELQYFYKNGNQIRSQCKECVKIMKKEYNKEHNEKINTNRRKKYNKSLSKVRNNLSYLKHKESRNKKSKEYYLKNKEHILNVIKEYSIKNKEYLSIKAKEYRLKNKARIKERQKKYNLKNKEKIKEQKKEYNLLHKDEILSNKKKYLKNKKLNNPIFKLKCNIQCLIYITLKNNGFKKKSKTVEILGCSILKFKAHLESKFTLDMNWENQGSYWELDHIKPISLATNEQELYKLNHYTNFQPLYWLDNVKKGNKYQE